MIPRAFNWINTVRTHSFQPKVSSHHLKLVFQLLLLNAIDAILVDDFAPANKAEVGTALAIQVIAIIVQQYPLLALEALTVPLFDNWQIICRSWCTGLTGWSTFSDWLALQTVRFFAVVAIQIVVRGSFHRIAVRVRAQVQFGRRQLWEARLNVFIVFLQDDVRNVAPIVFLVDFGQASFAWAFDYYRILAQLVV